VELIFVPFALADHTPSRAAGGTGLGLTVSRRLARLLGGDVRVQRTRLGEGSTFELELPYAAAPADRPARAVR
jgi:signal transduction histidine kinase